MLKRQLAALQRSKEKPSEREERRSAASNDVRDALLFFAGGWLVLLKITIFMAYGAKLLAERGVL